MGLAPSRLATNNAIAETNDIAVEATMVGGIKYLSYFELMSEQLLAQHAAYGITIRGDAQISKAARDDDPLRCDGEWYLDRTPGFGDASAWNLRG